MTNEPPQDEKETGAKHTVEEILNDEWSVLVFYSSDEHPQFIERYRVPLIQLEDLGVTTEAIDITENLEKAREHGVLTAPVVVVNDGANTTTYSGIGTGLREVLEDSLLGKSTLYDLCFEKGLRIARQHDITGEVSPDRIENLLDDVLPQRVASINVDTIDIDCQEATVSLDLGEESSEETLIGHDQFAAILQGFFTAVFGTAEVKQAKCVMKDGDRCVFVIDGSE